LWHIYYTFTEDAILRDTDRVEEGIQGQDPPKIVANASNIARRAYRVLQVAEQEAENSEDPAYVDQVKDSANVLRDSK
jgi:vinculin